jgi:uncharacterized protein (DUF305 family)
MTPRRARLVAAIVAAAILLGGGGYLVGRLTAPVPTAPGTTSAAAGFLRDMRAHHAQAVEMAMLVRDRTTDPGIRQLAYDIALTQDHQAGQMYGLLEAWDLPQAPAGPPMAWLAQPTLDGSDGGHGHDEDAGGEMPGMATDEELAELKAASGVEAERLFLELMIRHHRGGVEMAEAVLARTKVPQVTTLATGIIRAQTAEIDAMQDLLLAAR